MQFLQNITALLSLIELATMKGQFVEIIADICEAMTNEQQIDTIIYFSDGNVANGSTGRELLDLFELIHQRSINDTVAVMNTDNNTPVEQYAMQFNRNLLSIVQLSEDTNRNEQILDKLWQRLHRNMQSGLILLFDDTVDDAHLSGILSNCVRNHAINVIALQPNLAVTEHSYWTLQLFPKQQTIRRIFSPHYHNIFRNQMDNMHGYPLRILQSGWYPQIYNFTPKHGATTLSGYLGSALKEYAYRRNATIISPFPRNHKVYCLKDVSEILLNNSAETGPLWPLLMTDDNLSFSNALHMLDMCLMIPLEKQTPKYTFYYNIFYKTPVILFVVSQLLITCILTLVSRWRDRQRSPFGFTDFCNISVLDGLLGMPLYAAQGSTFIHKLIYIIIAFRAFNIDVAYNAYLQSFNCDAPIEPLSKTIDDIIKRGVKLTMDANHLPYMFKERNIRVNLNKFTLFSNSTELLILRDSLDTRYAFIVSNMWTVYEEQQKYFSRPLFRLTDICFSKSTPLVLPFHPNSMYRESLTEFMGRLLAAGLIKFWSHHSFFELVSMKKVVLADRNKQELFRPMKLEDLQVVIITMSIFFAASFCCFLLELYWQKFEKFFNAMVKIKRSITSRILFLR